MHKNIVYLLDEFAPYKKVSKKVQKLKTKPWINNDILKKINERDKVLLKYHKTKMPNLKEDYYNSYKVLRNTITKEKRDAKKKYYKEYFERHKGNSSFIWKGIKSIVKLTSSSKKDITLINEKGKYINDPQKIANIFNSYFVTVGPNIDKTIPNSNYTFGKYLKHIKSDKTFFLIPTLPEEISKIIDSLDNNKSLGPNSIPVFMLKSLSPFFSHQLSKIVNLSFITGIFPDLCKVAKVIPIFKEENELLCENYRPISLLPIYSKIFEKVIYTRMYTFLTNNKLIYERQFGFRSQHSSKHALISLTERLKSKLDNGEYTAGIFLDLQKAFDTVNHNFVRKTTHVWFSG